MGHSHGHGHGHSHDHHHTGNKKALMWAFILIASFMIVEVIGGIWTNSLALLSDAGHMLSDAAALGLSFVAIKIGEKKATNSKTFGYKRFEIIAASINGITLLLISLYIFYEAYHRILEPPAVQSMGMLVISSIGLLVNIAAAFILMSGDKDHNLNVRSAFLHVLGDLLGSVGAIAAALLIYFFGWGIADPIASVIVAVLILVSGWRVAKESFHILMEGTPSHLNPEDIKSALLGLAHVKDVHDLHIWTITSGFPSLSCHLVIENEGGHDAVLHAAQSVLHDEYGIEHSTIQVEGERKGCPGHNESCN
ncbi:zinc transporter ZitB [Cytobacillus firmus]|uniref:cation diffusion facilitator family transporter n=1 Tax=Cytobacillus firmus TaxID=1399 RepID=UPI00077C3CAD|nr:cation diffusion facilitator family transporter [Cytobacillus firmus]MBG9543452.1 zinc transporter ZitB [Cytobacillus firmus]MBG9550828.1 zinc transporter ZitB [Cytobacillus firmus]MBG9556306.1 zinc transporter ZitB [Cytobacillus firmus]MBG9576382.1 zinc transporter ZitB [Cytobacillus firmus]MEC1894575.1 cation diffusion facilitator family transporter [Cytobacillus firmus]